MRYISNHPEETLNLGFEFGKQLTSGDVVALIGELGTGKTVFTKGIAKSLGFKDYKYVDCPSFVILKIYNTEKFLLYHFDFYRITSDNELETTGYEEYIYSDGITVIEWADRAMDILPERYISVRFKHLGREKREIVIRKVKCIS